MLLNMVEMATVRNIYAKLELDLHESDAQTMTKQLRQGIVVRKPDVQLSNEVECDEVYVVAGHKGNPEAVKKSP